MSKTASAKTVTAGTKQRRANVRIATSALALATALTLAPQPVRAQAFLGTPTVNPEVVFINETATTTTITIDTPQAVIDWLPDDNAIGGGNIVFQQSGTTATFVNGNNVTSEYAVLNRIVPTDTTRAIELNGNIESFYSNGVETFSGGTIFFYSPGGIVVGSTAIIDVGSLGLTTNEPLVTAGEFISVNNNNQVVFQDTANAGAQISVAGSITALGNGFLGGPGYMAIVAPSIAFSGSAQVNDTAALVAADAATVTFSPDGLFDITVTTGTSASGTALALTGRIRQPLGNPVTQDFNRIYLVAVPQNDAITMAISGGADLGFDVAANATASGNNLIVLGANADIVNGVASGQAGPNDPVVDLTITNATIGGSVDFRVFGDMTIEGGTDVRGAFFGESESDVVIDSTNGAISIDGNLSVDQILRLEGNALYGRSITLSAVNNDILIDGTMSFDANAYGPLGDQLGRNAYGGTISLIADGAVLDINGNALLQAGASGEYGGFQGATGGDGYGGTVALTASNAGTIDIAGTIFGGASGSGNSSPFGGGSGYAGTFSFTATGASIIDIGNLDLLVEGFGNNSVADGVTAGNATGGTVSFYSSGASTITMNQFIPSSAIQLGARAGDAFVTGQPTDGGVATGGTLSITATGAGSVIEVQSLNLYAGGYGGDSQSGDGGAGYGGAIVISATGGASISGPGFYRPFVAGYFYGRGGDSFGVNGSGGAGTGGSLTITSDASTVDLIGARFRGTGDGGAGIASGGDGFGGTLSITATGPAATISADYFDIDIASDGGNASGVGSTGGQSTGGSATITVVDGAIVTDGISIYATANAGAGQATGGDGYGGNVAMTVSGGSITVSGDIFADTSGDGDEGNVTTGSGFGGAIDLTATGGGSLSADRFALFSDGEGGYSVSSAAVSGDAVGGAITITGDGGTIVQTGSVGSTIYAGADMEEGDYSSGGLTTGGTIDIVANGAGGGVSFYSLRATASAFGNYGGGTATGGNITLTASNGATISGTSTQQGFNLVSDAIGAEPNFANPNTGDAFAGDLTVAAETGGTIALAGRLDLQANANGGGYYYGGGNGTGGDIAVTATGSSTISVGSFNFDAVGDGGQTSQTGTAGTGTGGTILLSATDSTITATSTVFESSFYAGGRGGRANFNGDAPGAIINGGDGIGGSVTISANGATGSIALDRTFIDANGRGGSSYMYNSSGGDGTGGTVAITTAGGGAISIGGNYVRISSNGDGGDAFYSGGSGGLGTGGQALITLDSGSLTVVSFDVESEGGGGDGYAAGGDGIGGTATITVSNGATLTATSGGSGYSSRIGTGGFGGDGDTFGGDGGFATSGGDGTGGVARLDVISGGTATVDTLFMDSDGGGGEGLTFGGDATGGTVRVEVQEGGALSFAVLELGADAQGGGYGDTPGFAQGGDVYVNNSTIPNTTNPGSLIGTYLYASAGADGVQSNGIGPGGDARGGLVLITAGNASAGPVITDITTVVATANAQGGSGYGFDVAGVDGTAGGNGYGGEVGFRAGSTSGQLSVDNLVLDADGAGGDGGNGSDASGTGGDGGAGGRGSGGTANFLGTDGFGLTATGGTNELGQILISASGVGGAGGAGGAGTTQGNGGDGGDGYSGTATLQVTGLPVSITTSALVTSAGIGGDGGTGATDGAGGDGFIGGLTPGGLPLSILFAVGFGGELNLAPAASVVTLAAAQGGTGSVAGSGIKRDYATALAVLDGTLTGGNINMTAFYDQVDPGAREEAIYVDPTGSIDLTSLTLSTPGAVSFANEGTINADSLIIQSTDTVVSSFATPTTYGTTTAGNFLIDPTSNLVLQTNLAVLQPFAATSFGVIDVGGISAPSINLNANGGVTVRGTLEATAGDVLLNSGLNGVSVDSIDATGIVTLLAEGDVRAGAITAGGTISPASFGTVFVDGAWVSTDGSINVQGNDLVIAATGSLSGVGAQGVVIQSTNATMVIGDGTGLTGFNVDADEFSRISGNQIQFVAIGGGNNSDATLAIGDLTVIGPDGTSPNITDPAGVLTFADPGVTTLLVTGNLVFESANAGNRMEFLAEGGLSIDAETGGLFMLDANGAPTGTILIRSPSLWVAEQAILDQLITDPAFVGREDAINTPIPTARPDGVLVASTITIDGSEQIVIQNTGTADLPAGFLADFGATFEVVPFPDNRPIELIVNGQFIDANGNTIVGNAAAQDFIDGASATSPFTANSTVNGCVLISGCEVVPPTGGPIDIIEGTVPIPGNVIVVTTGSSLPNSDPLDTLPTGDGNVIPDNGLDTGGFDPGDGGLGEPLDPTGQPGTVDGGTVGSGPGGTKAVEETEEQRREREEEEEAARAPIAPPKPLIKEQGIVRVQDVNEPVSGTGNPALIGSPLVGAGEGQ